MELLHSYEQAIEQAYKVHTQNVADFIKEIGGLGVTISHDYDSIQFYYRGLPILGDFFSNKKSMKFGVENTYEQTPMMMNLNPLKSDYLDVWVANKEELFEPEFIAHHEQEYKKLVAQFMNPDFKEMGFFEKFDSYFGYNIII